MAAIVLALTIGVAESPTAYALFLVAIFTIVAVGQEFWRGTVARRRLVGGSMLAALGSLLTRNRRRYGGYVVHIGLVLALFGIAASSSFQTSRDLRLSPGDYGPGRRLHGQLRPPDRATSTAPSRSCPSGRSST